MPEYLVGTAFFLFMWMLLYALVPRVRWQMLIASLALAHFGLMLEYWYVRDYWQPRYIWSTPVGGITLALEDYLFGFAVSGLAVGLFALTMPVLDYAPGRQCMSRTWLRLQTAGVVFVLLISVLCETGAANSVHATCAVCLIGSTWVFIHRQRWIVPSLRAGCALAVLFFIFYEVFFLPLYPTIIEDWWRPLALSGLTLRSVPIEEVAWGFAVGVFLGPLEHACAGLPPETAAASGKRHGAVATLRQTTGGTIDGDAHCMDGDADRDSCTGFRAS